MTFQKMTLFFLMALNKDHVEYPINVHQFLLPNKNKIYLLNRLRMKTSLFFESILYLANYQ